MPQRKQATADMKLCRMQDNIIIIITASNLASLLLKHYLRETQMITISAAAALSIPSTQASWHLQPFILSLDKTYC